MDAKAMIPIGLFSRRGRTRVVVRALDHDFKPVQKMTPFGIFLPAYDELYLYLIPSRLTSDGIVDCLQQFWQEVRHRFSAVKTLLINQDNGPENHSRRTQGTVAGANEAYDGFCRLIWGGGSVGLLPTLSQQV